VYWLTVGVYTTCQMMITWLRGLSEWVLIDRRNATVLSLCWHDILLTQQYPYSYGKRDDMQSKAELSKAELICCLGVVQVGPICQQHTANAASMAGWCGRRRWRVPHVCCTAHWVMCARLGYHRPVVSILVPEKCCCALQAMWC